MALPARVRQRLSRQRIEDYRLSGYRRPGLLRLILASDVSGSMTAFAAAREDATLEFLRWAATNLRGDDEIGLLDFSDAARWVMRPTLVVELSQATRSAAGLDSGGTLWRPVVDKVAQLPECGSRTVVWVLSDGQYPDYPQDCDLASRILGGAGISALALLVPSHAIEVPDAWTEVFPDAACEWFDGHSRRYTALALARAAAQATGQRLAVAAVPSRARTTA